ncbi:MAG: DUF1549 and DUF1553 domain-containing protein [Zoogloea oleivorans]|jgi:hypothetical protein|uniref:DUF1549 and DUF1553 domain-containing protein n=1 Tax=Zoogloea oleivorans TaxID=1552750 RepID=UPI002A36B84E|nr:DUF1549 and DUF1553 domain-containing protein [Zoogloea oleivorans]MDY0038325.1 DUF1549 and DUF1553 domain-containing protein [Zoogloea oleivorans]
MKRKAAYLAVVWSLSGVMALESVAVVAAETSAVEVAPRRGSQSQPHWAYQPVARPATPAVKDAKWVRSPIDALVLAQLEAKDIKPSPDADRATLIRRVTLDTWGIIPTPEEVKAFVNDKSPNAYEKLVDRLLASSRYGERWGRRWLDLTRHADSDGYNTDGTRPNMWRYRDYVIKAFNDDKPYNTFIKEQLAGDELWPDRKDALVATGFLRNFPDEINARDLNLKKQEIGNDLADTVSSVFLATTANCAQCHNHKFDKFTQKEYYQLQAYFANTSFRDDVTPLTGKDLSDFSTRQAKWEEATKDIRAKQDALLKPYIEKAEADRVLGFVPETRESITKPEKDRNAYDRWIYHRNLWTMSGRTRNAANQMKEKDKAQYAEFEKLSAELKKFDSLKPKDPGYISTATELGSSESPPTHVLFKGIYDRKLEEVQPGLPSALSAESPKIVPTATSSGRRTAIAGWIASDSNPLTSRVLVNRVWNQYFGRGLVDTVNDFGKMGQKPVNPALLDYLADSFVKNGWSVKKLQKEILLSSVYRQSSDHREELVSIDPENKLLAYFPRQRLDAEQIRDSLLYAAGLLEEKVGGPSVYPPVPANFDNRNAWKVSDSQADQHRRSAYIFVRRNTPYPLLDTFDWANPQLVHGRREVTTTAPQALALANSDLVFEWSKALAGRVIREAGESESARLDRLYQIAFGRTPDKSEKESLLSFLDKQEKLVGTQLASGKKAVAPIGAKDAGAVKEKVEGLFKTLYGRTPDKFERATLLSYLDTQQARTAKAASDDEGAGAGASAGSAAKANPARSAAFVELVHAVVNSNEFLYRL